MRKSKLVLYNVDWQMLRVSLLSEENDYGGWGNIDGVSKNIVKLQGYIYDVPDNQERFNRLFRVNNLLAGVRLGYAQQSVEKFTSSAESLSVGVYQSEIASLIVDMKQKGFSVEPDTEEKTIEDIKKPDTDTILSYTRQLKHVWNNLYKRFTQHQDKAFETRKELIWFLNLLAKHRPQLLVNEIECP